MNGALVVKRVVVGILAPVAYQCADCPAVIPPARAVRCADGHRRCWDCTAARPWGTGPGWHPLVREPDRGPACPKPRALPEARTCEECGDTFRRWPRACDARRCCSQACYRERLAREAREREGAPQAALSARREAAQQPGGKCYAGHVARARERRLAAEAARVTAHERAAAGRERAEAERRGEGA